MESADNASKLAQGGGPLDVFRQVAAFAAGFLGDPVAENIEVKAEIGSVDLTVRFEGWTILIETKTSGTLAQIQRSTLDEAFDDAENHASAWKRAMDDTVGCILAACCQPIAAELALGAARFLISNSELHTSASGSLRELASGVSNTGPQAYLSVLSIRSQEQALPRGDSHVLPVRFPVSVQRH